MAEELEGVWRHLTLTGEEKECVETNGISMLIDQNAEKNWLVANCLQIALLTKMIC